MNDDSRLRLSFALLDEAMRECVADRGNALRLAALAKTFESTFEYTWKRFKREADAAGLEAYSPRESLKAAAQLGLIKDLEQWNRFLNARNLSVHDYVGMDDKDMFEVVREFMAEVRGLILG